MTTSDEEDLTDEVTKLTEDVYGKFLEGVKPAGYLPWSQLDAVQKASLAIELLGVVAGAAGRSVH